MNKELEMERGDLQVGDDIQVSDDGKSIVAYLEAWLDAEKKFNEELGRYEAWLNMYAIYDPFADTLKMPYTVNLDTGSKENQYFPTENEEKLVKDLIAEKLQAVYGQTPQEFCQSFSDDNNMEMGGQT